MTDPSSILPLTANTLNPFDTTTDTRSSVETERKQRSLIRIPAFWALGSDLEMVRGRLP